MTNDKSAARITRPATTAVLAACAFITMWIMAMVAAIEFTPLSAASVAGQEARLLGVLLMIAVAGLAYTQKWEVVRRA